MTANLTPAEARAHNAAVERAARCVASNGHPALADEIRALSVPIPPEPDAEAVVQVVQKAFRESWRITNDGEFHARAVIAALTAANLLRS
jgi:hypothetical protein